MNVKVSIVIATYNRFKDLRGWPNRIVEPYTNGSVVELEGKIISYGKSDKFYLRIGKRAGFSTLRFR